ncbi:MAG: hypothetical protein H6878_02435 [Rhodobiaceae bacterium]|nr:hypothetical protein [Rhodobiaceae bacterium]
MFAAAETVVRLAAAKGIGLELLVDATEGLEDAEVAFTTLIASVLQHEKSELAERHEAIEDSMWASIVGVATQVLATSTDPCRYRLHVFQIGHQAHRIVERRRTQDRGRQS